MTINVVSETRRMLVFTPRDFTDLTRGGVATSGWLTTRRTMTFSWKKKVGCNISNGDGTVDHNQ